MPDFTVTCCKPVCCVGNYVSGYLLECKTNFVILVRAWGN